MRMTKLMAAGLLATLVVSSGCGSFGGKGETLTKLQPGMSRGQVFNTVGEPKYVAAADGTEYLWYDVKYDSYRYKPWFEPYYVKLTDGQVESFGKPDQYTVQAGEFVQYDSPSKVREIVPTSPDLWRKRLYGPEETNR